ncbi:hypothetical protein NBO_1358g0001 [Nosema bombycis CQ1]|uniref:Uncharacterized protein n=1 Tax=Nosema bombycis (strain CQ1 / CVCC 102059) TaxID=578461 RepID=R0LZL9_NOSB1|nr:hypothetical protein NBO_1358g0001 [Nosema bombycis CQ1]|eukprot:EOB11244.1 hypothetical protein NBO_1358g0001 [Nosema bombycis CQ1]
MVKIMTHIFYFSDYKLVCNDLKHDFHYYLWQLDASKRNYLKRRFFDECYPCQTDYFFFKAIFLINIDQFIFFIKYFKISPEHCQGFYDFSKKAIKSGECIGLLSKELFHHIEILINQVKVH